MLEITNIKVYDLKESVIASGNAMRLEPVEYTDEEFNKGIERMKKLVKASKTTDVHCHDNALTGIRVSFDIKYPQYWSMEFQRYHFADIVTSSSKMHRLLKMDIDKACNQYVLDSTKETLKNLIDTYNRETNDLGKKELFNHIIANTPSGLMLTARMTTNYLQLKSIVGQRSTHKLQEWRLLCDYFKTLPMFDMVCK